MSPRKQRIESIFEGAAELKSSEDRAAYLNKACAGDGPLRQEVEELLQAHEMAGGFLAASMSESGGAPLEPLPAALTEQPGTVIGRYKLLQKIGEGGMGVVYMAEQEEPIRREVALKIIKLGLDTRQVVARFEAERQALAMMDHPNIAKVLDGGATDRPVAAGETSAATLFAGRPYFVMELVQGVPITEFCEKNQLTTEERIKLFIPVCQAIQSAHQKGIIHRDIKPSNVLVTLHDGVPVPKVIDFGVAKAINQKLTAKTLFTNFATLIGTPAYMSPEQAEMSGLDIDTRSDIYGLGVLLYELLTGTTPFPEKRLRSVAYGEMQRILLEEEPERPSARLTRSRAASAFTQGDSSPKIRTVNSEIDSDLDWIVMKCLEKDRQRRYETANGLVADVQRFLGSEPIVARPPSAAYRFQKWVRRHRVASMAVIFVAVALFLGVSVATWALLRERTARLRERAALEQANQHVGAANDFVKQVFGKVAPELSKLAGAADAQENLTQAGLNFVRRLRAIARDEPASRAALAQMLIQAACAQNPGVANSVGDYAKGLEQADEAFELLRAGSSSLTPSEHALWLYHSREAAVRCLWALGRRDEGLARVPELEAMLDQMEKQSSAAQWARERRVGLRLSTGAVLVDTGRFEEAIKGYFQPFLASRWANSIGEDSSETELSWMICANDNLTSCYAFLKDFDAMRPFANEAVRLAEMLVKRFPLNARYTAGRPYSWSMQGYAWMRTGRVNEGLAMLAKARQEIEQLIRTDAANDVFRYMRAIVVANQALAFAGWSQDSATVEERENRLSQAQTYLVEAEEFDRAAKAREQESYLKAARAEASAARAKIQADKNAQAKP